MPPLPIVTPALAPALIPAVALPYVANEWRMCCWYVLHPAHPYPEHWSSTVCPGHTAWYMEQLAVRRAAKLARRESAGLSMQADAEVA